MKINDIDLYNLPLWLNGVAEKLEEGCQEEPVSYTHLTLPTILLV